MSSSRGFVGILHRMAKTETTPAGPPPAAAGPSEPAAPEVDPLRPEELTTLRGLVLQEQLSPSQTQTQPVAGPGEPIPARKDITVSNVETILKEAMQIEGAIGVALVDYTSGMMLGQAGGGVLNMDVASAGNTEVVRAKLRTMDALGLRESIEDILITLDTQYHLIRLISDKSGTGLFLYLALSKQQANLAMARRKLSILEQQIEI